MSKTIFVGGYGPGISNAVAELFGREGYNVAIVGRTKERLEEGVKQLQGKGVKAKAFVADLAQPAAVRKAIQDTRAAFGAIEVLQWTAAGYGATDLLTASEAEINAGLSLSITSVVAAVQEALADLRETKGGVLLTNGGLGLFDDERDTIGVNVMGLAVGNSAKHKLSRVLAKKLKPEGVHLVEVMVAGTVKGSSWDKGNGNLDPMTVAQRFYDLYKSRNEHFALVRP